MADQPDPPRIDAASISPETPPPAAVPEPTPVKARRRRLFGVLALAVAAIAVLALLYHVLIGARHVSTDNAYVGADSAQVTPLVSGAVREVRVANTQSVRKGDILVVIDPEDARIVADRAQAEYAQAQRQLAETRATGGALKAQLEQKVSDIARAQAELQAAQAAFEKARVDLQRRDKLAGAGAVSGDELTSARNSFANAQAQLAVARSGVAQARAARVAASQSYAANQALVQGSDADNPDVVAARARYEAAKLDMRRTVIRAPVDGVIAQRNVQIGQRVAPGVAIMTVVPLTSMYVDANFKEGQLGKVKIGQPARLTADLYGGGVVYHGKVIGFSGGTGSAFSLIPAQNATGNWIKVVQRLPVRIQLDPRELRDHPLRVGLSMDADVDVAGD